MKDQWEACKIAFSMYSGIPMPRAEWQPRAMKHALCYLPLVGVVVGLALALWVMVCLRFAVGRTLFAAVAVALPVLLTGGIHMDGFADTVDAIGSHQPPQQRLDIMKDPRMGAFGGMGLCLYFLLMFGIWNEWQVSRMNIGLTVLTPVMSRAMAGMALVNIPCAKDTGLAHTFQDGADREQLWMVMLGVLCFCSGGMLALGKLVGVVCLVGIAAVWLGFRRMALHSFGGITGDLLGFFIQMTELVLLAVVALGGRL